MSLLKKELEKLIPEVQQDIKNLISKMVNHRSVLYLLLRLFQD